MEKGLILIIMGLVLLLVVSSSSTSSTSSISYKKLYCEENTTLKTKKFIIWLEEEKIKILKGKKKEICE